MSAGSAILDATAPAERLAAFRMTVGCFVLAYLVIRLPVFFDLADRATAAFDGVGVFAFGGGPMPATATRVVIVVALISGVSFTAGYRFRIAGPIFATAMLVLASYRSSFGQLLHFEHLFVLHLWIVALAPSADAWSLDARSKSTRRRPATTAYGWPLRLGCVCVVITYTIAGIAKIRYGGSEWAIGDTLRNHVAYSAVRLEVLGGNASPLAAPAVSQEWLFTPMAIGGVIIELAAPIALLGRRWATGWVLAAWVMHVSIFALMLVGFPYPLFLAAFAPFFRIERGFRASGAIVSRWIRWPRPEALPRRR